MTIQNMRQAARTCVIRAKNLLVNGDEPSSRYACLELRFAIEYLTYDLLQTYRDELPYDIVKKWQPREIISEMRNMDPYADCSSQLFVGPEVSLGAPPPTNVEWKSLGEEHRFTMEWANKNYNALGNYLHASTLHQLESGSTPKPETILARVTEVLHECERVLNSRIWNNNFGNFFWFDCGDCKTRIKGRVKDLAQKQVVKCRQCHAQHDIEFGEGQKVTVTLRKISYICPPPCESQNWVGIHRVVEGQVFICAKCERRATVVYQLVDTDSNKDEKE